MKSDLVTFLSHFAHNSATINQTCNYAALSVNAISEITDTNIKPRLNARTLSLLQMAEPAVLHIHCLKCHL